jgi:AAA domain, putative AbiEii toxin, Type IV TA system
MTNSLSFVRVHKSITSLEPISLPNFTVLTGVNGSGKTHLLMAIQGGQVASSLVTDPTADVRVFDSSNIVPKDTGSFDPAVDQTRRSQWFQVMEDFREKHFPGLQQSVISLGVPSSHCLTASRIDSLNVEVLNSIFNDPDRAEQVHAHIRTLLRSHGATVGQYTITNIGDEKWRKLAPRLIDRSPEQFLAASQADFFRNKDFLWGDVDPFQQAFGQVFATYRSLVHENDRLEKYPPLFPSLQRFLSERDFLTEYGAPPWDFVNKILETSNLDFRVDSPPMHETVSYEPKLRKQSKDVEMRFQDLSSGEKVLMSFALCIYNSQESRQAKSFPKLLLLDEIDAPLHPSMAAALINTIQNVLVRERDIAVILTTHSPSTVALAPDESIYAMDPTGPRVTKVSKGKALTLLTAGVPTLSVSFSGRRQVFVESKTDARLFDSLYQRYKSRLDSERSLAFVEVGKSNEAGLEQSGGCAQVIRLVKSLSDAGNESVLGLIDWDGKNERDARIHVLSQGLRDGLETAIFDPLLVVATLARDEIRVARSHDLLEDAETYQSLHVWDEARWQVAVNKLQTLVLGSERASAADSTEVSYLSGIRLNIRNAYLRMDDHLLETAILTKFPELKARNRHAGELMRHMLDTVLSDFEVFLPKDVLASLDGLLTQELG